MSDLTIAALLLYGAGFLVVLTVRARAKRAVTRLMRAYAPSGSRKA